ncbi:MAG: c-type cytochrome [Steroidobacteraceae bacterium]
MGSGLRAVSIAAIAACALSAARAQTPASPAPAAAPAAAAPAAQPTGDAQHGKSVTYTCLGCHGIEGYKNAYPMYSVPELRGQNPEYLLIALHGYRDGDRAHITMHSQTETLSEQDMADAAAFLAGKPLAASGKPTGTVPQAAQLCVSCHGQDGVAVAPIYPSLAGQHEDYIVRALDEYKHGGRKNAVMKGFAANLSDGDIAVVAAYFSELTPSLGTEPRPYTRLGE